MGDWWRLLRRKESYAPSGVRHPIQRNFDGSIIRAFPECDGLVAAAAAAAAAAIQLFVIRAAQLRSESFDETNA